MTSTSRPDPADQPHHTRRTTLAFTDPSGRRRTAAAVFGPENRRDPLLPHRIRNGVLERPERSERSEKREDLQDLQDLQERRKAGGGGHRCVQVRLSAPEAVVPAARALLDTEVGTALHLHRVFDGTPYAQHFPAIIGHELDTAEPYVLYEAPRGRPAARTHVISATDQRVIARDLMLAICLLEGQGLVPRGISPATVLWDGTAVQLWGLEAVDRVGRARGRWGRAPYCSPEQRLGEGTVDPRDAVWSAAQVLYQLVTGRPGRTDGAPADLGEHRMLAETLRGAFTPRASDRPSPARLLELLAPGEARRAQLGVPSEEPPGHAAAFEHALLLKRQAPPTEAAGAGPPAQGEVLCPYCLETIRLDLGELYETDSRMQYQRMDPSRHLHNSRVLADVMRVAVQKCTADPGFPDHYIPVPYLTNGRPLTVAMVGQSTTGKSHLLTQMIAEITDGGLEPFGLKWQSVNPEQHARFVRERVQPLRNGRVLEHTGGIGDGFARFVESLLITDAGGQVRPVAFFDLGGEDLVRTDSALRFLLGVDAMVFVVDPALALPLPHLDHARERWGLEVNRDGDLAFGTVLDRLPKNGAYLDVAAAMVLGKADLLRFHPPVDRWLAEPPATRLDPARTRRESRDVHGLLRQHAGQAWLRPFDTIRRCTLHVASATGGQEDHGRFPPGTRPRRVLEPLLSLFAMHGLLDVPGGPEALAVGTEPALEAVPRQEAGRTARGGKGQRDE
ncbi:hypothetical protein [Streptomyces pacificus]|uniref:Protein kinase domain-containing protein n=1 Tax=Streptomyces pacificus TaxID=2705029 RepID=A0A6A0AW06_9ACTN|nr:hypothetical protein [Streptomyces pacificus]GFH36543.1 hypothetical protein SCWH03_27720 [Streptomyces pacificus]